MVAERMIRRRFTQDGRKMKKVTGYSRETNGKNLAANLRASTRIHGRPRVR
jgi:hypothetical protein